MSGSDAATPGPSRPRPRPASRQRARRWRAVHVATGALVALHFSVLVAAFPDIMVTNDSAFHVALARQYAEHGTYFWDTIHYAPAHRPNLQGPAVHMATGLLGRLLGGSGDDYVRANVLLALAGWLAAVGTVVFCALAISDAATP